MIKASSAKPSIQYPIGSVIEDPIMIAKILRHHSKETEDIYEVEVLQWKIEPSDIVKKQIQERGCMYILVADYSVQNIKLLSSE